MGRIGIIGAMEEEVLALKEKLKVTEVRGIASLEFYVGVLHSKEVVLVRAGIGKVNAAICTQLLIDCFHVDTVINTGVGGALSDELNIGDIVISIDCLQHDMDASGFGYDLGVIPRMEESIFKADKRLLRIAEKASEVLSMNTNVFVKRIVSGDQFVSDPIKKKQLFEVFEGFCVEMEGAAIAHACFVNKIPFVIIRSISDKADDSAEINFAQFTQLAAANSCKMIEKMVDIM
ncbi:MAG: 5'-methylthioadenosine/adenosylhomocysteine nucleosidase [Vallitaleaceae bacterium]|nr:5'-methylthioadenosine/adenosylhomocysteine nucleosidase [Vallitaleaceae bacterium]